MTTVNHKNQNGMKRLAMLITLWLGMAAAYAQQQQWASRTTVYDGWQPAVVTLVSGKTVNQKQANIFLKNGSLVFKRGFTTMQANMKQIARVDFADQSYLKIDSLLAVEIDSVGDDKIYEATVIDLEAFHNMVVANTQVTNLEITDFVNVSTIELNANEDVRYPLVHHYYFRYRGEMVLVHERTLYRFVPKEKRRIYKTMITMPDFDWTKPESLKRLLKAIH